MSDARTSRSWEVKVDVIEFHWPKKIMGEDVLRISNGAFFEIGSGENKTVLQKLSIRSTGIGAAESATAPGFPSKRGSSHTPMSHLLVHSALGKSESAFQFKRKWSWNTVKRKPARPCMSGPSKNHGSCNPSFILDQFCRPWSKINLCTRLPLYRALLQSRRCSRDNCIPSKRTIALQRHD